MYNFLFYFNLVLATVNILLYANVRHPLILGAVFLNIIAAICSSMAHKFEHAERKDNEQDDNRNF